jgi:F-type H+-transporting ATPase subunit epsilon
MLNLEIVTPEKKVLSETVDAVTIPTASGEIGILQNNVSILSDIAETADEINVENARAERDSAERELGAWRGSLEEAEAERERLEIAQARLQLSSVR